jgi:histidinol-phosphate aminotransferase
MQNMRVCQRLIAISDYKDDGTNILLDANENAYGPGLDLNENGKLNGAEDDSGVEIDLLGLNRYPDPYASAHRPLMSHN